MVSINYSSREVCCKIVYYGPGLSGKTTNLQYVHAKIPGTTRGDLISLATEADRTLYFDFLPINIGTINGFAAKFQLYTVPGQVYYNATRKLVLRGVDGVVFVADSQPDKMDENIDSLANLDENLAEYGYDLKSMPFVLQHNKCDLPNVMTLEQMDAKLNPTGVPSFMSSATEGTGVFDTLKMIIKLVLDKAKSGGGQTRPNASAVSAPSPDNSVSAPSAAPTQSVASAPTATSVATLPQQPDAPEVVREEVDQAASASVVESAPVSEPASEPEQYRPYPGSQSQKIDIKDKKITPAAFTPAGDNIDSETPLEKKVVSEDTTGETSEDDSLKAPIMSPSLKKTALRKKRGFLKRLFGVR